MVAASQIFLPIRNGRKALEVFRSLSNYPKNLTSKVNFFFFLPLFKKKCVPRRPIPLSGLEQVEGKKRRGDALLR